MAAETNSSGTGPIADSYRVSYDVLGARAPRQGRFFAGEYPGAREPGEAAAKMARFDEWGVTLFIDLTEEGEYDLRRYEPWLPPNANHVRLPIRDLDVPSPDGMRAILDRIDAALEADETVYVHCFGGIGRTGTVVGCWLVRHGLSGEDALEQIARWRRGTPDGWKASPETQAQRSLVQGWAAQEAK